MERIPLIVTSLGEIVKPESVISDNSNPKIAVLSVAYRKVGSRKVVRHYFYERNNGAYYIATNRDRTHDKLYFIGEHCENMTDLYGQYVAVQVVARTVADRVEKRERKMLEDAGARFRKYKGEKTEAEDATYRLTNSLFGGGNLLCEGVKI